MNLPMKQKQTYKYRPVVDKKGWVRDRVEVQGQWMQTTIYKMDKQGPDVQHRELYSISCDKSYARIYLKIMYIDVYLNHSAVEQKLTQHCKSTIFQFKKLNWCLR